MSPSWGTADGWMPWRLVHALYDELPHVLALERVTQAQSTACGNAAAWGEKGEYKRLLNHALDEAYPR